MPDSAAGLVLLTSTGVPHETVPAADIGTTLRVR
jgi:hypothetical protein